MLLCHCKFEIKWHESPFAQAKIRIKWQVTFDLMLVDTNSSTHPKLWNLHMCQTQYQRSYTLRKCSCDHVINNWILGWKGNKWGYLKRLQSCFHMDIFLIYLSTVNEKCVSFGHKHNSVTNLIRLFLEVVILFYKVDVALFLSWFRTSSLRRSSFTFPAKHTGNGPLALSV